MVVCIEVINYLPRIKAPDSCVQFWVNQLQHKSTSLINSYQNEGYCSVHEIQADMIGFYKFYTKPRFVFFIFILFLFCNNLVVILLSFYIKDIKH